MINILATLIGVLCILILVMFLPVPVLAIALLVIGLLLTGGGILRIMASRAPEEDEDEDNVVKFPRGCP